jgi:haloalkane dehalogenase
MTMDVLRTPDERFADLPGWPFVPRYAHVGRSAPTVRMAYVDEGPRTARPIVLLHGEPTWSYLHRAMIWRLAAAGFRVVAPDLVGFGRSDKPTERADYTYARHVDWTAGLLTHHLGLDGAVLFCQDWGGLIGLRILTENPDLFSAAIASNTMLPTGDEPLGEGFLQWRAFSQSTGDLDVGAVVSRGSTRPLSPAEVAAYDAPFPDARHKAGALQFPLLVPASADDPAAAANRAAWAALGRWNKPFVCAFGDRDPVTRGADERLVAHVPGAQGQPHVTLRGAGHFSQEDASDRLSEIVLGTARRVPQDVTPG